MPDNALGITSSRIRWKGYTGSVFENIYNLETGTLSSTKSGTMSFPAVPDGGGFYWQFITLISTSEIPSFEVGFSTPYFGAGLSSDEGYNYFSHQLEWVPVQSTFNYNLELRYGGPVSYQMYAFTSYSINRNSLNTGVSLNGGESILCPVDDLNNTTESDWVDLQGLAEGTNNLSINVAGSKKVYYEVEYTYKTNVAPALTLTTADNQGLNKGRGDIYAAILI